MDQCKQRLTKIRGHIVATVLVPYSRRSLTLLARLTQDIQIVITPSVRRIGRYHMTLLPSFLKILRAS